MEFIIFKSECGRKERTLKICELIIMIFTEQWRNRVLDLIKKIG